MSFIIVTKHHSSNILQQDIITVMTRENDDLYFLGFSAAVTNEKIMLNNWSFNTLFKICY